MKKTQAWLRSWEGRGPRAKTGTFEKTETLKENSSSQAVGGSHPEPRGTIRLGGKEVTLVLEGRVHGTVKESREVW